MLSPRNVLYVFAATLALAVAACQPAPMPAELSAKSLDSSARPVSDTVERVAQKARDANDGAPAK
ncbi:MAG TPA: hypothetical protein VNU71_17505 [Burkholderiaceae bacterium]|nr:hypothetical protein [Burkholderiaceae bacterium]